MSEPKPRAGRNRWVNWDGEVQISETRPRPSATQSWFPIYARDRIHGDSYTPYPGITEWEQAANAAMNDAANNNFRRKSDQ